VLWAWDVLGPVFVDHITSTCSPPALTYRARLSLTHLPLWLALPLPVALPVPLAVPLPPVVLMSSHVTSFITLTLRPSSLPHNSQYLSLCVWCYQYFVTMNLSWTVAFSVEWPLHCLHATGQLAHTTGRQRVSLATPRTHTSLSDQSLTVARQPTYLTACNAKHSISKAFLSVCLSKAGLWQNNSNLCPHSYTTWEIIHASFLTRKMVGGGDPFYLKFWAKLTCWSENTDFRSVFARSASAVTTSEKFSWHK